MRQKAFIIILIFSIIFSLSFSLKIISYFLEGKSPALGLKMTVHTTDTQGKMLQQIGDNW